MMDIKTQETEEGTRIEIETEEKVAVAIRSGEEEIIYLPKGSHSDTSYYIEETSSLVETENGYQVVHSGEIDDIEVINGSN